jgi:hypothetical protein
MKDGQLKLTDFPEEWASRSLKERDSSNASKQSILVEGQLYAHCAEYERKPERRSDRYCFANSIVNSRRTLHILCSWPRCVFMIYGHEENS